MFSMIVVSNFFLLICSINGLNQLDGALSHLHHLPKDDVVKQHVLHVKKKNETNSATTTCHESNAVCVLPVQCPALYYTKNVIKCATRGGDKGRHGVCCTSGQNHTDSLSHHGRRHHHHLIERIDAETLHQIARYGRVEMAELHLREAQLLASGRAAIIPSGSASYGHFRNTRVFNVHDLTEVMSVANRALEIALATKAFKNRQGLTNQQLELGMVQQNLRPTSLGAACTPHKQCPVTFTRYRSIEGTCNNVFNAMWGAALTPYARLLPPNYKDGIWMPRVSELNGGPLTSPRTISLTLFEDGDAPHPDYTLMLMQFGQFLSHEVTQSIDFTFVNGSAISCCTPDGGEEVPLALRHFACMPISLPANDPFYSHFKQGCMNFVRSVMAPRTDCTLGYAQQMNKVTHFIDGSSIYGSTPEQTAELRSFERGQLKTFNDFGRHLLPLSKTSDACITMEQGSACFESGDSRTNQMISLVALHMLFMREHNRIAQILSKLNPHWYDEQLFLETRRFVVAELQVIVYKEFLPALLGAATMREFDIALRLDDEFSYDYDQRIEPSVTNEFASAAFRFGHSTVSGLLKIYGENQMDEMISLPEAMFYPGRMRKPLFYDQIMSTLTTEPIQQVDNLLSETLTKYMFRAGNPFGVDLASLNIQRGRDHGLRSYNDYRQLVGEERFKTFEEFGPIMGPKLAQVYASIDDVDLWVGGLLEGKQNGSVLGVTFRDIIADQFVRLKKGDKYFFDNDPSVNPSHFRKEQLMELRKCTLSRLICDNSDRLLLVRQALNAFRRPGVPENEFVDCTSSHIPNINMMYWKEF